MTISTYLSNALLNHMHGKTSFTMPTVYMALFTTAPTMPAGTGGTEVSGGSYARVATSGTTWNSAAAESISNATAITFPTASASWGTVVAVGAYDAATSGNLLWSASVTSQAVGSGVTPSISSGNGTSTM